MRGFRNNQICEGNEINSKNDDGFRVNRQLTKKHYYDIIHHIRNTYREKSKLAISLTEIFRNEGKAEGRAALANTPVELIAKFSAPIPEDMKNKLHQQQEISTLASFIKQIDEFQSIGEINQYLK